MGQRSQSAMEYLMTYGWSILIIAVVIVVLFGLGVFGPSSRGGTSSCVAVSGWQCTSPILYSSGALSLNIGEIGSPVAITGVGCGSNSTLPSYFQSTSVTVSSGQVANLTTSCPLQSASLGSTFMGEIWIQYHYSSNPAMTYNVVVANIRASVTGAGGIPGRYSAYIPVTIDNTNTVASTGPNFQQLVYFNPVQSSAYTANEASDLGNIRFYQGSTELYSWCESGCNTVTSTNAVFWVNIPGGIAAGTNVVVNMYFLSNTVEYDGLYAGEAPQLTLPTAYAQYDNGAKVFNFYDDFAGSTLNTNAWTPINGILGTVAVSNELTLTDTGSGVNAYALVVSKSAYPPPQVEEAYMFSGILTNFVELAVSNTPSFSQADESTYAGYGSFIDSGSGNKPCIAWQVLTSYGCTEFTPAFSSFPVGVWGLVWPWTGSETAYFAGETVTSVSSYLTLPSSYYLSLGVGGNAGSVSSYWARFRTYPPGGVMPAVSFGSFSH